MTVQESTLLFLSKDKFHRFLKLAPEILEHGVISGLMKRRTANSLKAIPLFSGTCTWVPTCSTYGGRTQNSQLDA